jgi:chloride channel 3/4/5
MRSPRLGRSPSISSRVSFAVSNAEQGETSTQPAPAEAQIEEEIAEIKRYEVCAPDGCNATGCILTSV